MLNFKNKPDMIMKNVNEQVSAIEVLRTRLTGIRRKRLEKTVDSKMLFDVLSSNGTQCIVNDNFLIFEYKNVTNEQLAMVCDYFQTELIYNGWNFELLHMQHADKENKKDWFAIGMGKNGVSKVASYDDGILSITIVK